MENKYQHLLETIKSEAKFTASYTGRKEFNSRVLNAIQDVYLSEEVTVA